MVIIQRYSSTDTGIPIVILHQFYVRCMCIIVSFLIHERWLYYHKGENILRPYFLYDKNPYSRKYSLYIKIGPSTMGLHHLGPWDIDSITVSEHSLNWQANYCWWPMRNGGKSHWLGESKIHWDWGNLNLYLDQPITKGWCCQPIRGHVSHPTDSPTVTRLWLCSSLWEA